VGSSGIGFVLFEGSEKVFDVFTLVYLAIRNTVPTTTIFDDVGK
jgi:hypothetical protein